MAVGSYGHLLRWEGLEALEAIHLANVDRQVYSDVFPYLSDSELDGLFNQFRGIAFDNIEKMDASRGATAFFPIREHAVSFTHEVIQDTVGSDTLLISKVSATSTSKSATSFVIHWKSILKQPLLIDEPLILSVVCMVEDSWVTRYPVVIQGSDLTEVALQGITGEMTVRAVTESQALDCISTLRVTS